MRLASTFSVLGMLLAGTALAATIPGTCTTPGSCPDLDPTFQRNTLKNDLRLTDSDDSNYVGLQSPATVVADTVWTLPAADGANGQALTTDGAGALLWATLGGAAATAVQTDADPATNLTGAAEGDIAYDTTDDELQVYDGTAWVNVNSETPNKFVDGDTVTDAVFTGGNVGIGTTAPGVKLDVMGDVRAFGNLIFDSIVDYNGLIIGRDGVASGLITLSRNADDSI